MRAKLVGQVSVEDSDGVERTPRGAKARAIVAMILSVPDHTRSRRWIEGKLWSDRGSEQASGSLRQALVQIRQALGPHADALTADRETISLTGISRDTEADQLALAQGREFLEGLDITDPAFCAWLLEARQREAEGQSRSSGKPIPSTQPLTLHLRPSADPTAEDGAFVSKALANAIGEVIAEFTDVERLEVTAAQPDQGATEQLSLPLRGLALSVHCRDSDEGLLCLIELTSLTNGAKLWTRKPTLSRDAATAVSGPAFAEVVFQAADAAYAATAAMPQDPVEGVWAAGLIASATRAMFTYDAARLTEADQKLAKVIDLDVNGAHRAYAWRAQLRQIMAVERTERDWDTLTGEADEFARRALESSEQNALILALTSQVRVMLDNDPELAISLAEDAHRMSPNNAFVYGATSGAFLRQDRHIEALREATLGARIAGGTIFASWWQALAGLSAMALGRFTEATVFYRAAYARSPSFRAPMRHLYTLYLTDGQIDKADRVLAALKRAEPDFSIDLMRRDPTYPVATLRKSGLLDRLP